MDNTFNISSADGKFAKSFADAVLVKPIAAGKMDFSGIGIDVAAPEKSCDVALFPEFSVKPSSWSHIALFYVLDNHPAKIPAVSLCIEARAADGATKHFEERFDMRAKAYSNLPEVGRILRGPSGTMSFPFHLARIPLSPDCAAALRDAAEAKITLSEPRSSVNVFGMAPVPWDGVSPLAYTPPEKVVEPELDEEIAEKGFALRFTADLAGVKGGETLLEFPGALKVFVRDIDADPAPSEYDTRSGNYTNFPMADGRHLVVEALMPGPTGRIGIPLGLLDLANPVKEIAVGCDGVKYSIVIDGHVDQDFPFDNLFWPKGALATDKARVANVSFARHADPSIPPAPQRPRPIDGTIQFWNPEGHNQWLGDVVVANFDGSVHVFYLIDRRHHNSKGGRGGHWFEHFASANLVDWTELPAAVQMDKREEYIGTGTPLFHEGRYYLAYGLHTRRHVPESGTTEPEQAAYLKEHGHEGVFRMADLHGLPMGGSYVVSDDAIHFTKSNILISSDQNPSLYRRDDGLIGLGRRDSLWYSDHLGEWKLWDADTPTFGDCPCPFSWNGWHYVIQGFCTMGVSPNGRPGTYADVVAAGDDIYDGLSVPMVVPYGNNRRLIAGWINHIYGWGGWFCIRELIQYPDGNLGMKWVPEIKHPTPPVDYSLGAGERFAIRLEDATGRGAPFEFSVDPAGRRAQFATLGDDGAAPRIPTLSEATADYDPPRERIHKGRKYRPDDAGDFAIGHIRGLEGPYGVRVVVHFDAKSGITLVDAEIAGQRTMVTRRLGNYRIVG